MTARLSILLLGGFEARRASDRAPVALGGKGQALAAFLAHQPGRDHARARLASLLWSDVPMEQALHSLRQAVFALRRSLGPPDVLAVAGSTVALRADAVQVDVPAFERGASAEDPDGLEAALALYRSDFLDGLALKEPPFERWLRVERQRLRGLAVDGLERLAAARARAGALDRAIAAASRLLTLEPEHERMHRFLIRLYLATGQRGAALRQYRACVAALEGEAGLKLAAETRQLYAEIVAAPAAAGARAAMPEPRAAPPTILLVEDEAVSRALLEAMLTGAGYRVVAVEDGAGALLELGRTRVDLVLADIVMPTLDGLALAGVMARQAIEAPVIFVTGDTGHDLESRALALGAADFVRKPVEREAVLLRIRRALAPGRVRP